MILNQLQKFPCQKLRKKKQIEPIVARSEASVDVMEITKDERVAPKKIVKDNNKAKPAKKENVEEGTFEKPKLKKAQTIKRAIAIFAILDLPNFNG